MELNPVIKGLLSYVPGLYAARSRQRAKKAATAEYCYRTWLNHLIWQNAAGSVGVPKVVAELGPGASLGVGLAALLSGASSYYALDVVKYSEMQSNLPLLDDIVELFRRREPVQIGWTARALGWNNGDADVFPHWILTDRELGETLAEPRVAEIRAALMAPTGRAETITVQSRVPWSDPAVIATGGVDLVVSNSVLEHVNDLETTYDAFARWLKPGGMMSHSIDFRSHFPTRWWNSHWQYSESVWRLIVGRKPYLINREPQSTHTRLMTERGFEVTLDLRQRMEDGMPRERLASRWQEMSDEDFTCAGAVVQSRLSTGD